jgi:hypothetical protein
VEARSSSETLQVGEQSVATAGSGEETQIGLVARADSRLVENSVLTVGARRVELVNSFKHECVDHGPMVE